MITVFVPMHGLCNVDHMPIELETPTNTTGHSKKLTKQRWTNRQRRNFFRHRIANRWNTLSKTVRSIRSIYSKPDLTSTGAPTGMSKTQTSLPCSQTYVKISQQASSLEEPYWISVSVLRIPAHYSLSPRSRALCF